ncbi:MAG TPA: hypothetical protein VFE98_02895 [Candidatus Bathyarchaeia archaeon]|nr:hypothetical protein [Candidatus Bathyarchaeia archaeon]
MGREYGWTPEQVDNAPQKVVAGLLLLLQATAAREQAAQQDIMRQRGSMN